MVDNRSIPSFGFRLSGLRLAIAAVLPIAALAPASVFGGDRASDGSASGALSTSVELHAPVARLTRELASAETEKAAQADALEALDALFSKARTAIEEHDAALEVNREARARAQAALRAARAELDALRARLDAVDDRARERRRQVSQNLASLVASARSATPDARLRSRLRAIGGELLAPWRSAERERDQLFEAYDAAQIAAGAARREVAAIAAQSEHLAKRGEALSPRARNLEQKRGETAALLGSIEREIADLRAELIAQRSARAHDAVVSRRETLDRAFAEALRAERIEPGARDRGAFASLTALSQAAPAASVASIERRATPSARPLIDAGTALPFAGEVVVGFGMNDGSRVAQGVTIKASHQRAVTSLGDGEVVFADRFKRYGMLLIIDHGEEYHSLLSGFSRLFVRKGDRVRRGQVVGELPAAGESAADLYVELRRSGEPVDPVPWLAPEFDKVRG